MDLKSQSAAILVALRGVPGEMAVDAKKIKHHPKLPKELKM